jgi:glycosyltransferase involved in cell wall biosynthesis
MEALSEYKLELHLFTAQTRAQLESLGIISRRVFTHSHIHYDGILEVQHKADILFLPLAFTSPIPDVIRTSAPGKLGEYLASGRPVLAHVPSDTFVAHYFSKYRCGGLADQNNVLMLAMILKNLITNPDFRLQVTQNARRQANIDFSPDLARHQFLKALQVESIR